MGQLVLGFFYVGNSAGTNILIGFWFMGVKLPVVGWAPHLPSTSGHWGAVGSSAGLRTWYPRRRHCWRVHPCACKYTSYPARHAAATDGFTPFLLLCFYFSICTFSFRVIFILSEEHLSFCLKYFFWLDLLVVITPFSKNVFVSPLFCGVILLDI